MGHAGVMRALVNTIMEKQMAAEMQENRQFILPDEAGETPGRKSAFQPDADGKYRWVYDMPMKNSFFLLFEVWRVLFITAVILAVIMTIISLISGDSIQALAMNVLVVGAVCAFLLLLTVPAYWIVTKANNGMYTVLFEMDGHGVDHIQIKTDKARALEILTVLAGQASHNPTVIGNGMIQAAGGSLYSSFEDVRSVQIVPEKHLIRLNGRIRRNQVYADDEIFEEVCEFICAHCVNAVIR